jgi:hypothetical protein
MTFTETHIELDTVDQWFLPEHGSYIGYDRLFGLYLDIEVCYNTALAAEFENLQTARTEGLSLEEALTDTSISNPESTYLAGRLAALEAVFINYMGDGDSD